VRQLPPELHASGGAALEQALRARRDALPAASEAFYRLLAEVVDVYATEQADLASIRRSPVGDVDLTLSAGEQDGGEAPGPSYFHRSFRASETSEIRLHLLGGADRVIEGGDGSDAIQVRIVPRDPAAGGDRGEGASAPGPGAGAPEGDEVTEPADDEERLSLRYERFRDWGADWLVFPQLSYDGTRGLFVGARLQRTHFAFGRDPWADRMNFAAAWSTALSEPRLEYKLDVRTRSPFGALAYVAYSGVDFANFFGLGNESPRDPTLAAQGFYRVHQKRLVVRPLATANLLGRSRARAGIALERFSNTGDGPASGAYGSGDMALASGEVGVGIDTRSGALTRKRGVEADLSVRYYPPWLDNAAGFAKLRGEATALFGSPIASSVLLGLRVAGEKNWGRYPFFEAASIGGAGLPSPLDVTGGSSGNLLRGYDLNRFAGDASVVANADLLIGLGRYSAIVPLRYGLLALADVGRVFVAQETSSRWHPGAGGGAWLALYAAGRGIELVSSVSLALVRSDEGTTFYVASALGF